MSGIAIILDLLRKNPSFSGQTIHSHALLSAKVAASAAAASIAAGTPFAYRAFLGNFGGRVAHCDAGAGLAEDYISTIRGKLENVLENNSLEYTTKEYKIELKPLFSAFQLRTLAFTSLRSFLLFYLPLLEPRTNLEENDDDFLEENAEERRVDLVVPFKKSVKQIARESTVVTTRRLLERLAVHYVSQRMAWKLLKDVPQSAARKAARELPTFVYIYRVSRTTLRGHFLGVLASWFIQVGIDIYRFVSSAFNSKEDAEEVNRAQQAQNLVKKVYITTIKCGSSLVFASIGAGIGAALFRPTTGQWIGCAAGDLAGPVVVSFCFERILHIDI